MSDDRRQQALEFALQRRSMCAGGRSTGGTVPQHAEHSADDIFARAHSAVEDHIQQFSKGGAVKDDPIGHAEARALGRGAAAVVLGEPNHAAAKHLGRHAADSLTADLKFADGGTVPEMTIDPVDVPIPRQAHVEVGDVKMPGDVGVTVGEPELGSVFEGTEAAEKRLGGREQGLQDDPVGNALIGAGPGLATSAVRGVAGALEGRAAQAAAARAAVAARNIATNQNLAKAIGSNLAETTPSAGTEAVTGIRALPQAAAKAAEAPVVQVAGKVAPGEAIQASGKTPQQANDEMIEMGKKAYADYLAKGGKPIDGFAHGGTVQNFDAGGTVLDLGDFDKLNSALSAEPPPVPTADVPVIADAAPVAVVEPPAAPVAPATDAPNIKQDTPPAISQQLPPDATATTLKSIEDRREKALRGTEVTSGDRIGRAISAGLSAFGGGTPTDFDARDRANRAEINTTAEGERHRALAAPGEAAAREAMDPNSPASRRLAGLAARIAPELDTKGLTANETEKALGLMGAIVSARNAGQLQLMQEKKLELDTLIRKDQITNQREANSIRLLDVMMKKRGLDQTQSKDIMGMLAGARTDPMTRQAYTDYGSIRKAEGILAKGHGYTPIDITLLGGELAKIATGGVPDQHTLETLTPQTAQRKLSEWYTGVTGRVAPAGLDELVNKAFGPYIADLKRKVGGSLAGSAARTMKLAGPNVPPHIKALLADPGALVDMMDAGSKQYEDSHGGPGAPDAAPPVDPDDDLAALGGHVIQ